MNIFVIWELSMFFKTVNLQEIIFLSTLQLSKHTFSDTSEEVRCNNRMQLQQLEEFDETLQVS